MLHRMASDKNKSMRQFFLKLPLLTGSTEIVWQATSYRGIFENGSLPLILGKTTTLPANRTTKGLRHGSFKATRSRNGKHQDQVPFYGSTGNVSRRPALMLLPEI